MEFSFLNTPIQHLLQILQTASTTCLISHLGSAMRCFLTNKATFMADVKTFTQLIGIQIVLNSYLRTSLKARPLS